MTEFKLDPEAYLASFGDVQTWINDGKQGGIDTGTAYKTKYGRDTTGWENEWVKRANAAYGRNAGDMSEFTDAELAQLHYDNWGKNENRVNTDAYKNAVKARTPVYHKWESKYGTDNNESAPVADSTGYVKWNARLGTNGSAYQGY